MIGIGLSITQNTNRIKLESYKIQIAALGGAVTNDDGISIYNTLASLLRSSAALAFFPYAYKGNDVYAMDANGNPFALTHGRGTNATYYDKLGKLTLASGPRFGYDPATLNYRGLIMERAATNLYLKSDPASSEGTNINVTYSAFAWDCGILVNSVVYGNNTATRYHYGGTVVNGGVFVISAFVKMDDGNAPVVGTDFALIIADNAVTSSGVINIGNGVYRVWGTRTAGANINNNGILKNNIHSARTFKVSGLQIETGSYPTTYIPTAGSTATRAADTLTSNSDIIGTGDASVYMQIGYRPSGSSVGQVITRGTGILWRHPASLPDNMSLTANDSTNTVTTGVNTAVMTSAKGIVTFGAGGLKACINNSSVSSASYDGSMGSGALTYGGSNIESCFIQAIVIVPRQFSNAEMQSVTT